METAAMDWRGLTRERALALFQTAWERAPAAGREAFVEAARREAVGHRWETGRHACVLALLRDGQTSFALGNIAASVGGSLAATWLGYVLERTL